LLGEVLPELVAGILGRSFDATSYVWLPFCSVFSSCPSFISSFCVWFSHSLCFFSLVLLPCSTMSPLYFLYHSSSLPYTLPLYVLYSLSLSLSLFSPPSVHLSSGFYSSRIHAFSWLLQEDCNGRRALWWRGISAIGHAPLIEAAPLSSTVETVVDEEGNEQLSRKWHHFNIQNEHFWFGHWIFCNFVIKPPW